MPTRTQDPGPRTRLLPWLLAFAGIALLAIAQCPEVLTGELRWDERVSEYIPWRVEAARQFNEGLFPFYTDKVFGGMPLFSTAYCGVLYPLNWLYRWFPANIANVLEVLHTILGGMGMFAYLRSHRLQPAPSFMGAVFFLCGTFLMLHTGHVSMREAACLAPWVVLAARRLLRRPCGVRAAAFAAAFAVQLLVGYAQTSFFTVAWIAVEWAIAGRSTAWIAGAGALGGAMGAAVLLPAMEHAAQTPRTGLTLESWQSSSFHPGQALIALYPRLFGFHAAEFWGEGAPGEVLVTMPGMAWVLALAAVFLVFGSRRGRAGGRRRMVGCFALGILVAFFLAAGRHFPPNALLFHVPPFSMFRIPARWLFLANAFGAVLAAVALNELMRRSSVASRRSSANPPTTNGQRQANVLQPPTALLYFSSFLSLHILLMWLHNGMQWRETALAFPLDRPVAGGAPFLGALQSWGLPGVADFLAMRHVFVIGTLAAGFVLLAWRRAPAIAAVALLAICTLDNRILAHYGLAPPGDQRTATEPLRNPIAAELLRHPGARAYSIKGGGGFFAESLCHNTPLFGGIATLGGYCPLLSADFRAMHNIGQDGGGWNDAAYYADARPLENIGVTHIVVHPANMSPAEAEALSANIGRDYEFAARTADAVLLRLRHARPRAELAPAWYPIDEAVQAYEQLHRDPRSTAERPALLEGAPWTFLPAYGSPIAPGEVRIRSMEDDRIRIDATTPSRAVLLVRNAWWPGWRWRVLGLDEQWKPLKRANGTIGYVPLQPGYSRVEIEYRPATWPMARAISLGAAGLALLLVIGSLAERRTGVFSMIHARAEGALYDIGNGAARPTQWIGAAATALAIAAIAFLSWSTHAAALRVNGAAHDEPTALAAAAAWRESRNAAFDLSQPPMRSAIASALAPEPGPEGAMIAARKANLALWLAFAVSAGLWLAGRAAPLAGVSATAVLACEPTLLGHATVIGNDAAAAAFCGWAAMLAWSWRERGGWWRAAGLGCAVGAAMLAKVAAFWFGAALLAALAAAAPRRSAPLLLSAACAWLAICAAYGFVGVGKPLGKIAALDPWDVRLFKSTSQTLSPLPEDFLRAVAHAIHARGEWYFRGTMHAGGSSMLYFPVALAIKLTLPALALAGIAAALCALFRPRHLAQAAPFLAAAAAFWIAITVSGGAMYGVRHGLPLAAIAVLLGCGALGAGLRTPWRAAIAALALASAAIGLRTAPHSLAYYNEVAGGPANGWRWLGGSNQDWGQGAWALRSHETLHNVTLQLGPEEEHSTGTFAVTTNEIVGYGIAGWRKSRWLREDFEPVAFLPPYWHIYEIPKDAWESR